MKAEIEQALDDLAELTRHEVHDGSVAVIRAHIEELTGENERLHQKTAVTMGVGAGDGKLFVHGDYESIKAAQDIVLERDGLRGALAAGDERLVAAAERAGVAYTGCDTPDALVERVEEQGAEIERLLGQLEEATMHHDASMKVIAEALGLDEQRAKTVVLAICELKSDLAAIRSSLSLLGDGEPVELAKLAAKVISELAGRLNDITGTCPPDAYGKEIWDDCDTKCKDGSPSECWIRAALDAAKGGE